MRTASDDGVIYQASDLARQRVDFISDARRGRARLRDKDGTGLVMLPESELAVLESYASWSQTLERLTALLTSGRTITPSELGELAWLRVFDREDVKEFVDELHMALVVGLADQSMTPILSTLEGWRKTARQVEDPQRRAVLTGVASISDHTEAIKPDFND
ncbi:MULTISPECIES: hypothetical protein [unclassified Rathayibacter]|uniref:hypothetical protein n=1 Tax=unclassified Rathayibacter TaxID=2609250 RepID=UPI0011B03A39|nr:MULTISPECIES: hypothetical protein [unclassified Rathayibacter]